MRLSSEEQMAIIGDDSSPPHGRTEGKSALSRRQKSLVGWETFVSLCGWGGGVYMATHPLSTMSLHYLHGTWFHTWRWPGIALAFFVGFCPALVVVATMQRRRLAVLGHLCVGLGLIGWVALEAAWIVVAPGLQIAVGAIGALILFLGIRERTRSGPPPAEPTQK